MCVRCLCVSLITVLCVAVNESDGDFQMSIAMLGVDMVCPSWARTPPYYTATDNMD